VTEPGRHPSVALVLLNNTCIGGAERRFAQVYEGLRRRHVPIELAINESLLTRLQRTGVLASAGAPALVLREPVGRLVDRLERWRPPGSALVRFLMLGLRKLDYVLGSPSVCRWVMRRRPEVMHVVLGGAYVTLPLQILRRAPPAVVSVVAPSLRAMAGSVWGMTLYRLALRSACIVDALTESIRDAMEREGIAPKRIHVSAGSCVNADRFQPAATKRPWVVFSGRLVPEKDPALFVEACALVHDRLRERQPAVQFFLLGEGPLRSDVERRIRQRGLQDRMQVGWCERVETVLGEAQVFVSLQQKDNYPSQVLLEAMACGMAVVATDVGLTWKLVDEAVGKRVPATPAAVADAVVALLENPGQTAAMGRRARERVMRHHTMEAYLDYVEGLYANAC
jgi:glycosyltransferase involved in cell wall biosynthesis